MINRIVIEKLEYDELQRLKEMVDAQVLLRDPHDHTNYSLNNKKKKTVKESFLTDLSRCTSLSRSSFVFLSNFVENTPRNVLMRLYETAAMSRVECSRELRTTHNFSSSTADAYANQLQWSHSRQRRRTAGSGWRAQLRTNDSF